MKSLLIIGARGFGREIYHLAIQCSGHGIEFRVKGFLDDKADALDAFDNYPSIINSVEDYQIEEDDVFICALGDVAYKKKYTEIILHKNGTFYSLIHPTAIINPNSTIGEGAIIGQYAVISCDVTIGKHTVVHSFCDLGHDVQIGAYCSLGPYSFMGGYSKTGDLVTLHPKASVLPHKRVNHGAIVGAGSVVMRHVPEGITVHGNPAVRLF